ncbi:T-cell surface glycoprotein CD3 zeta chain [Pogoniulus pusillus]|uniref:T-cell surface glycoprotein CD3 zeta chain n=1 Tax=Pogoniulus pusillus TaxID=488313 RepID=UPI0030B99B04
MDKNKNTNIDKTEKETRNAAQRATPRNHQTNEKYSTIKARLVERKREKNLKGNPKHQCQEQKPNGRGCSAAGGVCAVPPPAGGLQQPAQGLSFLWRQQMSGAGGGDCFLPCGLPRPSATQASKMKWRRIAVFAVSQAQFPVTGAVPVLGLTDPRLCYILDGFLFIYAVVITALFVKAKLSQASEPLLQPGQDDVYNKLSRGHRDEYDVLGAKRGADPELGGRHQQRRKNPQDTLYTSLQKDKMGEAYSEIGMKGEQQRRRGKGNEGVYQGLSAATKDTYDALQMQPLPPR